MAAGSLVTQFTAADLYRETSLGYNPWAFATQYVTNNGSSRGACFNKFVIPGQQLNEYYNGMWILPTLVALGTGLTFKLILTDDGTDPADLGKVVQVEVTPFNLSVALAKVDWSLPASKGTATTQNVTLGATTGLPVIGTVAIVAANLAGLAAGGILGVRIRRVGDNAADTCNGRVILLGGEIADT
jgi:hypothetical protein